MKTKSFIISVVALCCSMAAQAQTATLQKSSGDVTVYYGAAALQNALNNAEQSGSVITLSSGGFTRPETITKSVKIYGAGYETDASKGITRTYLTRPYDTNSYVTIGSTTSDQLDGVTIEGVFFDDTNKDYKSNLNGVKVKNVKNVVISKCKYREIYLGDNNVQNVTVRQCYITSQLIENYENKIINGLLFQNCYISANGGDNADESLVQIDHCILTSNSYNKAIYTNSIINGTIGAYSTAKNCIFLTQTSLDETYTAESNWFKNQVNLSDLFTDGTNLSYSSSRTFTLKDPSTYVGDDGTTVGINGGGYTWNIIPTTPIVNGLTLTPSGTTLNVTYDVQTREDPNTLNTGE